MFTHCSVPRLHLEESGGGGGGVRCSDNGTSHLAHAVLSAAQPIEARVIQSEDELEAFRMFCCLF